MSGAFRDHVCIMHVFECSCSLSELLHLPTSLEKYLRTILLFLPHPCIGNGMWGKGQDGSSVGA
jgi:hypothetical protein